MDTRIMKLGLVLLVAVSGLGGCASGARMVRADARGGELETWGPVVPAHVHMRELLVEHCQGRFSVAELEGATVHKTGDKASNGHARLSFSCGAVRPGNEAPLSYPVAAAPREQDSVAAVTPAVTPELRSAP